MRKRKGDMAVVVDDCPAFDGDEHGVPIRTVVTIGKKENIHGKIAYRCSYYNCGHYTNFFYDAELAVVG
jgi:hypothetical protein